MNVILPILWFLGVIAGIWFIVSPKKSWPLVANRKRALGFLLAVFFGLPIVSAIINSGSHTSTAEAPGTPPVLTAGQTAGAAANTSTGPSALEPPSNWTYDESKDEMRGTVTKYAHLEGNEEFLNSLSFGAKKTELQIQKRGKTYEVALDNPNLQFTCNNFTNTHMEVKFDDGPVTRYGCTDAKGDKFGVAFLNPAGRFVGNLRKAKKVRIEAEIFQRGDVQMTFDVSGLNF